MYKSVHIKNKLFSRVFFIEILANILANQCLQYLQGLKGDHEFNGCYLVSRFSLEDLNFHFIYVPKREDIEFQDEKYPSLFIHI